MIKSYDSGMTLVELVVTLTITALFITTFSAMYLVVVQLSAGANNTALASNYGYSILRKYVNSKTASNYFDDSNGLPKSCDDQVNPGGFNDGAPKTDGSSINDGRYDNPPTRAAGSRIVNNLSITEITLPKPATYSVIALAPYGCAGADWGRPLKIQVDVTYGSPARTVSHASYATF